MEFAAPPPPPIEDITFMERREAMFAQLPAMPGYQVHNTTVAIPWDSHFHFAQAGPVLPSQRPEQGPMLRAQAVANKLSVSCMK